MRFPTVVNYIIMNKSQIKTSPYYNCLYIGDGDTVIDQEPYLELTKKVIIIYSHDRVLSL